MLPVSIEINKYRSFVHNVSYQIYLHKKLDALNKFLAYIDLYLTLFSVGAGQKDTKQLEPSVNLVVQGSSIEGKIGLMENPSVSNKTAES